MKHRLTAHCIQSMHGVRKAVAEGAVEALDVWVLLQGRTAYDAEVYLIACQCPPTNLCKRSQCPPTVLCKWRLGLQLSCRRYAHCNSTTFHDFLYNRSTLALRICTPPGQAN